MKIATLCLYPLYEYHFETELEIIQNHLDQGDDVTVLACNGHLSACEANICHQIPICLKCIDRRKQGLRLLSKKVKTIPFYYNIQRQKKLSSLKYKFSNLSQFSFPKVNKTAGKL